MGNLSNLYVENVFENISANAFLYVDTFLYDSFL